MVIVNKEYKEQSVRSLDLKYYLSSKGDSNHIDISNLQNILFIYNYSESTIVVNRKLKGILELNVISNTDLKANEVFSELENVLLGKQNNN